jgi:uncharacterized metal-binding protein YceD (DUF177 family)
MTDFAHRLPIDQIRDGERIDLDADEMECTAVAERLGLLALSRLVAHAIIDKDGDRVRAKGRVKATLEQACAATGEPVPTMVDEAFDIRFVPAPSGGSADEEYELGNDELDIVFHDGLAIDLGGAIADTLSLALDPYPRSANAGAVLREAGVMTEEEASPFAALAALKGKLSSE